MNTRPGPLTPAERSAVRALLRWARRAPEPELLRALLFGSRARGDHDGASDLDLLLIFAIDDHQRPRLANRVARAARSIAHREAVPLQTWTLGIGDLAPGRRTPMLVDAAEDGLPLWPPAAPPLRLPFTPADACFCANRLLEWVDDGGPTALDALASGRTAYAARRIRDDITRLAMAALLVTGDTRHRRTGSLARFGKRLAGTRGLGYASLPALEWAASAYPPDDGRGTHAPPVSSAAIATAALGLRLATRMQAEVVPWIRHRLRHLEPTSRVHQ